MAKPQSITPCTKVGGMISSETHSTTGGRAACCIPEEGDSHCVNTTELKTKMLESFPASRLLLRTKKNKNFTVTPTFATAATHRRYRQDIDMPKQVNYIDAVRRSDKATRLWREYYDTCAPAGVHTVFIDALLGEARRRFYRRHVAHHIRSCSSADVNTMALQEKEIALDRYAHRGYREAISHGLRGQLQRSTLQLGLPPVVPILGDRLNLSSSEVCWREELYAPMDLHRPNLVQKKEKVRNLIVFEGKRSLQDLRVCSVFFWNEK